MTSLALVTASAQAAPSATGVTGSASPSSVKPAKVKIKGAKVYEYCGTLAGCPAAFYFATYGKTKTWEFVGDPGYGGYYYTVKKVTYFIYADGQYEGCYLEALKYKSLEYYDGVWECYAGFEEWYAVKV